LTHQITRAPGTKGATRLYYPREPTTMSFFSQAATWDPIGVGDGEVLERCRRELFILRSGIKSIIEDVQGLTATEAKSDARNLVSCIQECIDDQRAEAEELQRELQQLRSTISLLQEERRKYTQHSLPPPACAAVSSGQPPPPHPHAALPESAAANDASEEAMARRLADAADAAASSARQEERERASAAIAALGAKHAKEVRTLCIERDAARASADGVARGASSAADLEREAICACLGLCIRDLELRLRAQAEAHQSAMQRTKQRAAQMLAKSESSLSAARRARRDGPLTANVGVNTEEAVASGTVHAEGAAVSSAAAEMLKGGVVGSRVGSNNTCSAGGAPPQPPPPPHPRHGQHAAGAGGCAPSSLLASAANGVTSPSALAPRFARRIAELEASLSQMRETNLSLEAQRADDEKRRRALRARVAKHERAGGADVEYLRNVLLQWFMRPSERAALFPVIAAACAFSAREIYEINRAREASAPVGSWLFGGATPARDAFADGPPGTPLTGAPARGPRSTPMSAACCTAPSTRAPPMSAAGATTSGAGGGGGGGGGEGEAAMRAKLQKLRWLLSCANAEIQRLKGDPQADPEAAGREYIAREAEKRERAAAKK
jgi:hypothetical protein